MYRINLKQKSKKGLSRPCQNGSRREHQRHPRLASGCRRYAHKSTRDPRNRRRCSRWGTAPRRRAASGSIHRS